MISNKACSGWSVKHNSNNKDKWGKDSGLHTTGTLIIIILHLSFKARLIY